jgi:hypothetical protein
MQTGSTKRGLPPYPRPKKITKSRQKIAPSTTRIPMNRDISVRAADWAINV